MENIRDILKAQGIELDEDKFAEVERAVLANYRTKAELDSKSAKLSELEAQLKEANAAIETAKQADTSNAAEMEQLHAKLEAYEQAEREREAKATEAEGRAAFDAELAEVVGEKKFANKLVADAVTGKAYELRKANPDMALSAVLESVVGDADGVWLNPQQDVKKMPSGTAASAAGTQAVQSLEDLKGMSVEEVRKHMGEIDRLLAAQK